MLRTDKYIWKEKGSKGKLSGMTQVIKLQNISSCSLNVDKQMMMYSERENKHSLNILQKIEAPRSCQTISIITTVMS